MTKNLVFSLLLLIAFSLSAQNYQPFYGPDGRVFRYEHVESPVQAKRYFSIRVARADTLGGDSIWRFPRVGRGNGFTAVTLGNEHDLGAFVTERPGGLYEFHSLASGDTIFLNTQLPLNTPWTFRSDSSITATIASRSLQSIFGSVMDSVVTISLSDGNSIEIAQNYGMLSFPSFSMYFRGDTAGHYSPFEPPAVPKLRDFYSWQPGDRLGYYEWKNNGAEYFSQSVVDSVVVSADEMQLDFLLDRRTVIGEDLWDTVEVFDAVWVHIDSTNHGHLLLGTGEYQKPDMYSLNYVEHEYLRNSDNNLFTQHVQLLYHDTIDQIGYFPLYWNDYHYSRRIGEANYYSEHVPPGSAMYYSRYLECYDLGDLTKLPCRDLDALLTVVDGPLTPEGTIDVFPNPSDGYFQLRWENPSPKNVAIAIYDLGGRKIWGKQASVLPASGGMELHAGLQAGIYLLVLSGGDGILWREKVVVR